MGCWQLPLTKWRGVQILYLVAKFKPKLLQAAPESGPYGVRRQAVEAALAAKKAGCKEELCQAAQKIASDAKDIY